MGPVKCGTGSKTRTRKITTHARNGGIECGISTEQMKCNTKPCPIVCEVDQKWGPVSPCSKSCGGGLQFQRRSVKRTNAFGGKACPPITSNKVWRKCNIHTCSSLNEHF